MPTTSTIRRRLAALGLGCVVALGAAELALRVIRPDRETEVRSGRNPMAAWAHVDAFCAYRGIPGPYLGARKTVNADGFISTPELPRAKADGTLRVAFLGGSSTAGTVPFLGDDETWPYLATARMRQAFPDRRIEFLNAALPGYSTFESYGRLWSRVRAFAPDIVVVYHGWNDMYYFGDAARVADWRVGRDGDWTFQRADRVVEIPAEPVPGWAAWSALLSTGYRAFGPPVGVSVGEVGPSGLPTGKALAHDFDPAAVDVFRQNLELMAAAQRVLGFELYLCKQATLIVPDLAPELRERCAYRLHGFDHDAHVRAFDAIYAAIDTVVPAEQVIDLRALSGSSENFVDHIHLTDVGAQRVAERVGAHLAARLATRAAASPGR